MATAEKNLANCIREHCGENNILAWDVNVGGGELVRGGYFRTGLPKGFPDLLLIPEDGVTVYIEVKTKTGRLAEHQRRTIELFKKRGAPAFVVWSFEGYLELFERGFRDL